MKKEFALLACVLLLGISCTDQSTELTDEQKATIISEVEDQLEGMVNAANQLDVDAFFHIGVKMSLFPLVTV